MERLRVKLPRWKGSKEGSSPSVRILRDQQSRHWFNLSIENTLKQLPHFASPPDGKPNNNTAPKVGREYPEFRCPDCPQGVKGYKYGKTWGHHFIKDHQQMYPALDGNGYWCCAKFQTVESLAEHRWKYHVETGQE